MHFLSFNISIIWIASLALLPKFGHFKRFKKSIIAQSIYQPFEHQAHKIIKHTGVFDRFVGLELKGLNNNANFLAFYFNVSIHFSTKCYWTLMYLCLKTEEKNKIIKSALTFLLIFVYLLVFTVSEWFPIFSIFDRSI